MIDYKTAREVVVTNQAEMDAIPLDYNGSIYVNATQRIVVSKKYIRSVVARGNSSVAAWGNSQVVDASDKHNIKVFGNARIVYNPRTAQEYADHIGADVQDGKIHLFKAVHKRGGGYYSDHDGAFAYSVGEEALSDRLDFNPKEDCGHGIHAAHVDWCLNYGKSWPDLAILEVEMDLDGLVVPINDSGKVRAAKCRVIREVPLEECGLHGKILAKRRGKK